MTTLAIFAAVALGYVAIKHDLMFWVWGIAAIAIILLL